MQKQEDDVKGCQKKADKEEQKDILKKMETENENVEKMMEEAENKTITVARDQADWEMQKEKIIAQRKLKAQREKVFTIR